MLQFTRFTITDLSIWFRVNLFVAGRANMWLAGVLYSLQSYTNFLCDESVHSIGYKGLVKGWVSSTDTSVLSFGVLRSSTPQLCFSLKLLKMYVLSFFQLASVFSPPYYFYVTCWVCDHALWHFHWCWITHDDSFHTWHLIQFTFNSDQLVWSNITQRIDTAAGALVLGIGWYWNSSPSSGFLVTSTFVYFWITITALPYLMLVRWFESLTKVFCFSSVSKLPFLSGLKRTDLLIPEEDVWRELQLKYLKFPYFLIDVVWT